MPVPDVWPKDIFKSFKIIPTKHLSNAFKNLSKIAKGTWKAMGTAAKEIKTATNLFAAFGSESLITKVFDKVIGNYTKYLSDTFWGEVVKGIDFDVITTTITDILGPVFSEVGSWIGAAIEEAPIGTVVGASIGYLIKGPIGALIGGMVGFGIETLANFLQDISGSVGTIEPHEDIMSPIAIGRYYSETGKIMKGPMDEEYMQWWARTYISGGAEVGGGAAPMGDINMEVLDRILAAQFAAGTFGSYQFGGLIPRTGPYLLHKREEVIPANRRGSQGITINIDLRNAVVDNVDRLSQKIAEQVMIRIG